MSGKNIELNVHSGRLMEGDRLLEVNGTRVTGMSQNEVVAFLGAIPEFHVADILVSRHEVENVPRETVSIIFVSFQLWWSLRGQF